MRTAVIELTDAQYGDHGPRTERGRALRASVGVEGDVYYGIDARRLGLKSERLYTLDDPAGTPLSAKNVGTWVTHRALWAALLLLDDQEFMILEDDALFPPTWGAQLSQVLADAPPDWDFINIGPCCAADKPRDHVKGQLYVVAGGPMCMHAYLVRRRGLLALINTQDAVGLEEPIDISIMRHSLPFMKAFTVLPRIVDQLDMTDLAP